MCCNLIQETFFQKQHFHEADTPIVGKKLYAKQILAQPEVYFTDEVMQALDEIAHKEFSYGS